MLVAIGSFLASIQHRYTAYSLFVGAVVMVVFAVWAAYVESIPKPHIVPVGYGTVGELYTKLLAAGEGVLFENDGEAAYKVTPPKPTRFGTIGDPMLVFDDPGIARLTKEQGVRCFPVAIKDSFGERTGGRGDLRMQLALSAADSVLISFRYADSRQPQKLRYTTICKIISTPKGIAIELVSVKFAWWAL